MQTHFSQHRIAANYQTSNTLSIESHQTLSSLPRDEITGTQMVIVILTQVVTIGTLTVTNSPGPLSPNQTSTQIREKF